MGPIKITCFLDADDSGRDMQLKLLENLSNKNFKSRVKHIQKLPDNELPNRQLFYTIDILDQAISKGNQVAFHYNEYHTDKKLYPRLDHEGMLMCHKVTHKN